MRKSIKIIALVMIFLTSQFSHISHSYANEETEELIHLVVLADISLSLQTVDTKELQQLIQNLPTYLNNDKLNNSKVSIIAFATEAVQICETKQAKEIKTLDGSNFFRDCTNKIQSSRSDNLERDNRVEGVGKDTNQIKAFERGLEVISNDEENYVPVFLLLTDGELDPLDTGAGSPEANNEYERGYLNIAPVMIENNVQLFIFGFGNAKASALNTWLGFSAERRACQEQNPQRVYLNEENRTVSQLQAGISTAMKQVTCGESKDVILLEPSKPHLFDVSDLWESVEIKINLNGVDGVQPIVQDSAGNAVVESNFDEECEDAYIFCYQELNPVKGVWSANTEVFDENKAGSYKPLIPLVIDFYGTFYIESSCNLNTLKDGVDQCKLELLPTRSDATDLSLAVDKAVFNAQFSNSDREELIEFSNNQLTINAFEGLVFQPGFNEMILQPVNDGLKINSEYKDLQYKPTEQWSYEVIPVTTTTTGLIEEEIITEEEGSFPWVLVIGILLLLLALLAYLASRKRFLPGGKIESYNSLNQKIDTITLIDKSKFEYFYVTMPDDSISIKRTDDKKEANLILSSEEKTGVVGFFTNRDEESNEISLKYIDAENTHQEQGFREEEVEIRLPNNNKIKFIAEPIDDEYNSLDMDDDNFDLEFED
tara:strand:+ start:3724 stop:5691 length:1968 start_codon:yes stop_codon:yes gene_type:complete